MNEWQWDGTAFVHNPRGRKCLSRIEPMEFETLDTVVTLAQMHKCRA